MDCDWITSAETAEEILRIVSEHSRTNHNMEMTQELIDRVLAAVRDAS